MQFLTIGLNHHTAPLALRERVAVPSDQLSEALSALLARFGDAMPEAAILSTCNRTEIYAATARPLAEVGALHEELSRWLAEQRGVGASELAPHWYRHAEADSVRHAYRVASGLDSMVLGEPQIAGQMKEAAREADAVGALGTHLHQLFQRSFAVAKTVRTTTAIGAASVSMAAAAVRLAERIFERISDQHALFIGAGDMIELAATHFAARTPASITVANRTLARGEELVTRLANASGSVAARAMLLSELPGEFAHFDIVVSCTASSLPLVGLGMVERAIKARRHKPLFMVDLAVPRDIEAEVGRLDDVFLYTVDDLGKMVASGLAHRQDAVAAAEAIISAEVAQFMRWRDGRSTVPAIRDLHARGEAFRAAELERARRRLARGDDPDAVLEALALGITNKFLHGPTQLLHDAPDDVRAHLLEYLPRLFGGDRER